MRAIRGRLLSFLRAPRGAGDAQSYRYIDDGIVVVNDGGRIEAVGPARRTRRAPAGGCAGRAASRRADHAGLHRPAYPLSADPGDRVLRRPAARMAGEIHLRRGAKIRRSGTRRAQRRIFSRRTGAQRHHHRGCLLHGASGFGRRAVRRRAPAQRRHDRRQRDHEPQRAAGTARRRADSHCRQPRSDPALARHRAAALCGDAALRHHLDRRAARRAGRAAQGISDHR